MSAPTMQDLLSGSMGGAKSEASLQRELVVGFELEHRRKAEDEMKKRAIRTAGSYDEFKNLVAAATQKPIEAKDYGSKAVTSMNKALGGAEVAAGGGGRANGLGLHFPAQAGAGAAAAGAAAAAAATPSASAAAPSAPPSGGFGAAPNTPGEFDRAWRRLEAPRRPAFLAWLQPTRLAHAFRMDIDGSQLGAIVGVLGAAEAAAGGGQAHPLCEEWAGLTGQAALLLRLELAAALLRTAPPSSLGLAVDTLSAEEQAAAQRLVAAARGLGVQVQALELLLG